MRAFAHYLLIGLITVSCGTAEDSRYRDTSLLERPPTLVVVKSPGARQETDDSAIPEKQEPGLGEAVSLTETMPPQLKLKQPLDKAWNVLNQALKLNGIKITDHERDKGHIYVSYHSKGLFEQMTSLLKDNSSDFTYLLSIEGKDAETTVTAALTKSADPSGSTRNPDGYNDQPIDESDELLETLYKTIRDDLVEE